MSMFHKHPLAEVESTNVGEGTTVWAFAHVLSGARIGRDCNICDHTFIENDVVLGDRVTVKSGVQLWDGVRIEDDVFIGPNATFTNDNFPRSKQHQPPGKRPCTTLRAGSSVGANATILSGITVGERAMIGAGTVVTRDVPPDTIVTGNPARIVGYVGAKSSQSAASTSQPAGEGVFPTAIAGVTLHGLPLVEDLRGYLSFGESQRHIPFEIKRYFLVFGVPGEHIRGEHAHRTLKQFLVCIHGSCRVVADDGKAREEFVLDRPSLGLYLPAMTWAVQYKYSADAVLLVLASDAYEAADYIRDYREFMRLKEQDR